MKNLPRKKSASKSLNDNGAIIYVKKDKDIIKITNYIGPEHIEILLKNYKKEVNAKIESSYTKDIDEKERICYYVGSFC